MPGVRGTPSAPRGLQTRTVTVDEQIREHLRGLHDEKQRAEATLEKYRNGSRLRTDYSLAAAESRVASVELQISVLELFWR